MAVLAALGASVAWGVADFFGGLKSRTLGALAVMLAAQLAGTLVIAVVVAATAEGPDSAVVLLAAPAAVAGTLGLYAFYRGMAAGAISIVAPIAGVSAVIPVVFGVVSGDRPSRLQAIGIAVALGGVALAAREPAETRGTTRIAAGAGLALLAAIGFGSYFPVMHAAARSDVLWAVLVFRLTATSLVVAAALAVRPPLPRRPRDLAVASSIGVLDMTGNFCFALASSRGLVSIVSVLSSLYPVVTVVLARAVLSERVARSQQAGAVAALTGVALISGG